MSTVKQPSLQAALWHERASFSPSLCAGELHGGKGQEGTPGLQRTVQLHLEVQPLAGRLVSTQLASSEAVRSWAPGTAATQGHKLSASTDARPRSGLSWPREQLKSLLLKWESEHGAMPNPSQFLNPSMCPGHPERNEGNSPQPPGSRTPSSSSAGATLAQAEGKASPTKAARAGMLD